MARHDGLDTAHAVHAAADGTRHKIDEIVRSVIDAGHDHDFEAIARREIHALQREGTRAHPHLVSAG